MGYEGWGRGGCGGRCLGSEVNKRLIELSLRKSPKQFWNERLKDWGIGGLELGNQEIKGSKDQGISDCGIAQVAHVVRSTLSCLTKVLIVL